MEAEGKDLGRTMKTKYDHVIKVAGSLLLWGHAMSVIGLVGGVLLLVIAASYSFPAYAAIGAGVIVWGFLWKSLLHWAATVLSVLSDIAGIEPND